MRFVLNPQYNDWLVPNLVLLVAVQRELNRVYRKINLINYKRLNKAMLCTCVCQSFSPVKAKNLSSLLFLVMRIRDNKKLDLDR